MLRLVQEGFRMVNWAAQFFFARMGKTFTLGIGFNSGSNTDMSDVYLGCLSVHPRIWGQLKCSRILRKISPHRTGESVCKWNGIYGRPE